MEAQLCTCLFSYITGKAQLRMGANIAQGGCWYSYCKHFNSRAGGMDVDRRHNTFHNSFFTLHSEEREQIYSRGVLIRLLRTLKVQGRWYGREIEAQLFL